MIEYGIATKEDINELIRLRINYMKADFLIPYSTEKG